MLSWIRTHYASVGAIQPVKALRRDSASSHTVAFVRIIQAVWNGPRAVD